MHVQDEDIPHMLRVVASYSAVQISSRKHIYSIQQWHCDCNHKQQSTSNPAVHINKQQEAKPALRFYHHSHWQLPQPQEARGKRPETHRANNEFKSNKHKDQQSPQKFWSLRVVS
jgi:hypothetical protein